jgi:hypothetical protein
MYPTCVYICPNGHRQVAPTSWSTGGHAIPASTRPCDGKNDDGTPCQLEAHLVPL